MRNFVEFGVPNYGENVKAMSGQEWPVRRKIYFETSWA